MMKLVAAGDRKFVSAITNFKLNPTAMLIAAVEKCQIMSRH